MTEAQQELPAMTLESKVILHMRACPCWWQFLSRTAAYMKAMEGGLSRGNESECIALEVYVGVLVSH